MGTADSIAAGLAMTKSWPVLPGHKAEAYKSYRQKEVVAMVGDSINGAPRWRRPTGIAIGTGTDTPSGAEVADRDDRRPCPRRFRFRL